MTRLTHVRDARADDIPAIEAIIRSAGLFTPEEADGFASTLPGHFDRPTEAGAQGPWLVTAEGSGAAHLAPEAGPGVWNLLFIGVRPEARRRGAARALIGEVERRLRAGGARMLLIDTSTEPPMEAARQAYARLGYERIAKIPDYWGPGDGKLTFRRML